ncbi:MAG: PKD domain-containing protein [Flavobacteriales bacterium]|nr:PKD domain-containing protein [Flavobacteriales bacterium]
MNTRLRGAIAFFFLIISSISLQAQECGYVYVSPNGANSGSAGTRANPASFTYGLTLMSPINNHMRMAQGTYTINEPVTLTSNYTIEGGFETVQWIKSNTYQTIIQRSALNVEPSPNRITAFRGVNASAFRLQDLTITVANATGNGVSVYGIYLNGCSNYNITRCQIIAGNGSPGLPGNAGAPGDNGAPGGAGQPGEGEGTCCREPGLGGSGTFPGSFAGGNGGMGGQEGGYQTTTALGFCVVEPGSEFSNPGAPGLNGQGPQAGTGGVGGIGVCELTYVNTSCIAQMINHGASGANGADGLPGAAGAQSLGVNVGGYFLPTTGFTGANGANGTGGGGGGGGGGKGCEPVAINPLGCAVVYNTAGTGGGGGGGGEGGQGGYGGLGGSGGGGSFAVYVWNNGFNGYLQDCTLQAGQGGSGGIGGAGGPGGLGGAGGAGGRLGDAPNNFNSCNNGEGGNGGNGGNGGQGGQGGQGSEGLSMTLFQTNTGEPVFVVNNNNPAEPPIFVNHFGCTNSDVIISTTANGILNWLFDYASTPSFGSAAVDTVSYFLPGFRSLTLLADGVPYRYSNFVTIRDPYTPPVIQASQETICAGGSITFTTQPVAQSYQWTFPGGSVPGSSAQNPPAVTFNTPGTYEIQLVTTSCCGTHITKKTVNVINSVTVNLGSDIGICFTDPLPILNAANPGATYSWTKNGAPFGGNTQTLQTNGEGTYGVTVSYGGSCVGSDQIQVLVASTLPINLGADTAICISSPFPVLNAGFANASLYQWSFNGNPIGMNSPLLQTSAPGVYALSVTSNTGCLGTDTLLLSISDPQVNLGPNLLACSNESFPILNAGSQGINYQWTVNGNPTGTNSQFLQTTVAGTYQVSVTNQFGCTAVDDMGLVVEIAPTANFTYPPTVQVGQLVSPVNTSNPLNTLNYFWNFGDNSAGTPGQNASHTYNAAGLYSIFLLADNGICKDTSIQQINVLWDCPTIGLSAQFDATDTVYMSLSGVAQFTNQSTNAVSYLWNFGDGSGFTTAANPYYVYTAPGVYTVTLTAVNYNCTTTVQGTVVVIAQHDASLEEQNLLSSLYLFPNPASDNVTLTFTPDWQKDVRLTLTDMSGRVLRSQTAQPMEGVLEIDLQGLASGMYFVTLTSGGKSKTLPLIKQ